MTLIIDNRETHLIEAMAIKGIEMEVEQLVVGDIMIRSVDAADPGKVRVLALFERKTYSDLVASLKDNRYREQKHRLEITEALHKGYIIEGTYPTKPVNGIPVGTIDSLLIGLTIRDKFSVLYSTSLMHTIAIIEKMRLKIPEYLAEAGERDGTLVDRHQEALISTIKKENMTGETCYLAQLCQLPGISVLTARELAKRWPDMLSFAQMVAEKDSVNILGSFVVGDRRLGKVAEKVVAFMKSAGNAVNVGGVAVSVDEIPKVKPKISVIVRDKGTVPTIAE